jgi:hypothetical protein
LQGIFDFLKAGFSEARFFFGSPLLFKGKKERSIFPFPRGKMQLLRKREWVWWVSLCREMAIIEERKVLGVVRMVSSRLKVEEGWKNKFQKRNRGRALLF